MRIFFAGDRARASIISDAVSRERVARRASRGARGAVRSVAFGSLRARTDVERATSARADE
jgi:hypothetical protein